MYRDKKKNESTAPAPVSQTRQLILFNVSGAIGTALFYFFYEFVLSTLSSTLPSTRLASPRKRAMKMLAGFS